MRSFLSHKTKNMAPQTLPRGLRNCNPLNIRKGDNWQGLAPQQTDASFCTFKTNAWGYRAAIRLIYRYQTVYKKNTIEKIISRWAPPEDRNNTKAYIKRVSQISGIAPNINFYVTNKEDACKLVRAMAIVENGEDWKSFIRPEEIAEGWNLAEL